MLILPGLRRFVALYLAMTLLLLAPAVHIHQARAEAPGVAKVMLGALTAGGVLFALSSLAGPTSAVATIGAAGSGCSGAIGSAVGAAMTGVSSLMTSMGTMASGVLSSIGLCGGSTAATAAASTTSSMGIVPLALIGAGLLAYYFYNHYYSFSAYVRDNVGRYDRTEGKRYADPTYKANVGLPTDQIQSLSTYAGGIGSSVSYRPLSFWDRFQTSESGGTALSQAALANGYYSGIGNFYLGGPAAFSSQDLTYLNGFGTATTADSVRLGETDRIGRGVIGSDQFQRSGRVGLQPASEPQSTDSDVSSALKQAEDTKTEAYNRMVQTLKSSTQGVMSPDVQKAISNYKAAEARVKELSGRK